MNSKIYLKDDNFKTDYFYTRELLQGLIYFYIFITI